MNPLYSLFVGAANISSGPVFGSFWDSVRIFFEAVQGRVAHRQYQPDAANEGGRRQKPSLARRVGVATLAAGVCATQA